MKNDEQNFMPFIKLRYQNSLEMSPNSTLAKPYLKNIGSCAKVSYVFRYLNTRLRKLSIKKFAMIVKREE